MTNRLPILLGDAGHENPEVSRTLAKAEQQTAKAVILHGYEKSGELEVELVDGQVLEEAFIAAAERETRFLKRCEQLSDGSEVADELMMRLSDLFSHLDSARLARFGR